MKAEIKRFATQWFVAPHDGRRGGIAVASYRDALALCDERGWEVEEDGLRHLEREVRSPIPARPFMSFAEWCAKRVMTRSEYERLKSAGELEPMGAYVIQG